MKVELRPLDAITPYARNPRKNDAAVDKVAASLKEFGWRQPIVVDEEGVILAGHTRYMAARRLGMAEAPVHTASGLSPAQARAYRLADNRTGQEAEWDVDLLRLEVLDLDLEDYDLGLTGFNADELEALLAEGTEEGQTDPDEVPPVEDVVVTQQGDLWLLGSHQLICGDSTAASTVERVLAGVEPHLMVTDPPYGVEYDADWRNRADRANGKPYGARAVGAVSNDDRADWSEAYALFPGDVAYVWHPAGATGLVFGETLQASGFEIRMVIVWAKNQFPIGRGNYHVQHEPCYYAVRKRTGATAHWCGSRKESTLWQIDKPRKSETGHSTQKPVECMKRPIENNSSPGQAVYEPFSGSGTTIIAAEMTRRICYAIEIEPKYVDVAVRRWQQFTGKAATLEATGQTFDEIAEQRMCPAS